ncbi:hypothetical protein SAY87_010064 [Trapa incisa]|uniref:Uncharacterized protein n=1 Tax=Trapa incisa TaxID=236973 RepID=A0AAN7JHN8_9MYRT|nr:hypothetical protein SAY87_010064 [Trapa incisa]
MTRQLSPALDSTSTDRESYVMNMGKVIFFAYAYRLRAHLVERSNTSMTMEVCLPSLWFFALHDYGVGEDELITTLVEEDDFKDHATLYLIIYIYFYYVNIHMIQLHNYNITFYFIFNKLI